MVVLRLLAAAAVATAAVGCNDLAPSFQRCAVTCGAGGSCPSGHLCAADNFCHADSEFPVESCLLELPDAATEQLAADAAADAAAMPDAGPPDAAAPDAEPGECDLGTATNSAAVADPTRFAAVVPFAGGADLPAGSYRIEYVDGCHKYAPTAWWSVHARATGDASWWLVDAASGAELVMLPGTVGLLPGTGGPGDNGFELFADCVAANLALDPIVYDHGGGALGIHLSDIDYRDNLSGEDGRNPAWRLVYPGRCSDLGL
jgi:hypothetical protein